MHTCPLSDGPKPHVGGPILPPGELTVLIGGQPAARVTDKCTCVGPPDVIAKGSPTVLIGNLMAARLGDLTVHGGVITVGCPTVVIGEVGMGGPVAPTALVLEGTDAEQKQLKELVEKIRNSGPKGKAFIEALEKGPTKTRLFIGKSVEQKDGTVISLADTGGGVTIRPTDSKSGDNEVHIDPTNLIDYTATDGSTVKETPEGLLAHEMGHAKLLNDKDPAQTTGGPDAEKNVRTETNPIREELGMKPEK
jgi:uncharacterized Zn-binding protein involved in type VI secretion